jgi:hypothetical protein
MDRMTMTKPLDGWRLGAEWKAITLGELHPTQCIEVTRDGHTFQTSAGELRSRGMPAFLTMAQVEWAFSTPDEPDEVVVPMWRNKTPNGRR